MSNILLIMRVISSPQVAEQAVLASLRDAFGDLSRSETPVPGQFVIELPGGGDVIHYPAVLPHAGVYAVKVSPYLPDPAGPAVVTAWTMLVSLSTGQPVALLDASGLTVERTAATTVLAADLLLPPDAATAAVIGYGRIGRAHARYLSHLRPGMTVRAFSPGGIDEVDDGVRAVASIHDAVTGADLVMLCTSAADDVLDPAPCPQAPSSPRSRPTPLEPARSRPRPCRASMCTWTRARACRSPPSWPRPRQPAGTPRPYVATWPASSPATHRAPAANARCISAPWDWASRTRRSPGRLAGTTTTRRRDCPSEDPRVRGRAVDERVRGDLPLQPRRDMRPLTDHR
ncbi:hypothetical protein O1M54_49310 [Streptomyces diastatochromogenes]|nr:hypothetical protein [Streptomyces diastatochromogenes]